MYATRLRGKVASSTAVRHRSAGVIHTASGVRSAETPNTGRQSGRAVRRLPSDETVVASGGEHPPAAKRRSSQQSQGKASKRNKTVVIAEDAEDEEVPISTSATSSPRASPRTRRPTQRSREYLSSLQG